MHTTFFQLYFDTISIRFLSNGRCGPNISPCTCPVVFLSPAHENIRYRSRSTSLLAFFLYSFICRPPFTFFLLPTLSDRLIRSPYDTFYLLFTLYLKHSAVFETFFRRYLTVHSYDVSVHKLHNVSFRGKCARRDSL
jgi:hypothetical protein